MKKAILLALLILSLEKEEFDEFIWLMRSIQNRDESALKALTKLQTELNELE